MSERSQPPPEIEVDDEISQRQYMGNVGNSTIRLALIAEYMADQGGDIRVDMVNAIDLERLGPESTAVDLGCCDGTMAFMLRDRGYRGRIVGMDISEQELSLARMTQQRRQDAQIDPPEVRPIVFLQGDMHDTKLPNESVDLVLSSFALHHSKNVPAALEEIYRIMKVDAQFLASGNSRGQKPIHTDVFRVVANALPGLYPPARFAENFNTETAEVQLADYFEVLGGNTIRQQGVLTLTDSKDDIEAMILSILTYMSAFDKPITDSDERSMLIDVVIRPYLQRLAAANNGKIPEIIDRAVFDCRRRAGFHRVRETRRWL